VKPLFFSIVLVQGGALVQTKKLSFAANGLIVPLGDTIFVARFGDMRERLGSRLNSKVWRWCRACRGAGLA